MEIYWSHFCVWMFFVYMVLLFGVLIAVSLCMCWPLLCNVDVLYGQLLSLWSFISIILLQRHLAMDLTVILSFSLSFPFPGTCRRIHFLYHLNSPSACFLRCAIASIVLWRCEVFRNISASAHIHIFFCKAFVIINLFVFCAASLVTYGSFVFLFTVWFFFCSFGNQN